MDDNEDKTVMEDFSDDEEMDNDNTIVECCECCPCCLSIWRILKIASIVFSTILTVCDLFGLILVISFIAHMILLIGLKVTNDTKEVVKGLAFMFITGYLLSNTLVIPMYLFSRFSYYYACPFYNIQFLIGALFPCCGLIEYTTCSVGDKGFSVVFNSIFLIMLIVFIVLFATSMKHFDNMAYLMIVIMPLFRYVGALILYGINGWIGLFVSIDNHGGADKVKKDPILLSIYTCNGIKGLIKERNIAAIFSFIWLLIKVALSLACFSIMMQTQGELNLETKYKVLLYFGFFVIGFPLMVNTSFVAYWCDWTKECGDCNEKETKEEANKYRFLPIYAFSIVAYIIVIGLSGFVIYMYDNTDPKNRKYSDIKLGENYIYTGQPAEPTIDGKKEIISPLCYVKPYGLKMIHYAAIAYSTYNDMNLYNESDLDNNEGKFLREFFYDPNYMFSSVKSMDLVPNELGAANYFNFNQFNLTVIGIRGTEEKVDWNLDVQIFLSSALLKASTLGIIVTDTLPFTSRSIREILAYPLTILSGKKLLDKYMNSIDLFIKENEKYFNENIIFVGHSLGGGLAKLYGHIHGCASVSISGPGMTLLQTVYPSPKKDLNMVFTQAEVIPDRDVVPRVETSAGTKYRVLCKQDLGTCHGIDHTLCMMGLMCQTPHDSFCSNLNKIDGIYNEMKELAAEYDNK